MFNLNENPLLVPYLVIALQEIAKLQKACK